MRSICCAASLLIVGCAATTQVKPSVDPGRITPGATATRDQLPPSPEPRFSQSPELALQLQKMPLYSTGIPEFLRAHPTYDGRGVLLAILDSGLDAGIAGLDSTSTGDRKILDLRDFSREGRIVLAPVVPRSDSITVGGVTLAGFGRVLLFNARGPWYGGMLRESALGKAPAADVDGNGTVGDSLVVIVTRASDGWILMADANRDGSLAGERPVHDYLTGRDLFGWSSHGRAPRLTVAANFSESGETPRLDLFFDTSGHGSHVAGIAAGYRIYGVKGLNGVAPGAQILGLKIANNAEGGLSTTGSMIEALDYAIRFAGRRRLPLVVNMSFGVGNEIEGTARIDRMIDSVLEQHPELVFTISAGNDGPGLSTVGFPGSAVRALTVGAILPGDPAEALGARDEPVAYFSSRGGELAKPEIVTPGTAYSTVPLWDRGNEVNSGTSMASPHAGGLAALLLSALRQAGLTADARTIKQALMVTAHPIADESILDQGAGIPDVGAAFRWLSTPRRTPDIQVRVARSDSLGFTAVYRPTGLASAADTIVRFELIRPADLPPATYALRSNSDWLVAPATVTLAEPRTAIDLRYRPALLPRNETATGVVSGWPADTSEGPAFRLVNTIGSAVSAQTGLRETAAISIPAGSQRRVRIVADSGKPFEVTAHVGGKQPLLVFLHEPNGMPLRGGAPQIAGAGEEDVSFKLDGRDVVGGPYEVVSVAPPTHPSSVRLVIKGAPATFDARRDASGVIARVRNESGGEHDLRLGLVGGERIVPITSSGSDTVTTAFDVPSWATHVTVDMTMDPAQWSMFTDLGLMLSDSAGREIESAPLNYAFGRLDADFEARHPAQAVAVQLFPGLAIAGSRERWRATLNIRLYAESAVPLSPASGGASAPNDEDTTLFTMIASPWPLGRFFYPLGLMEIEEHGEVWTREIPLPEPSGPLMR
ncbi:MAG: S8 family serine peptidase [Gemmatimonadota bacterium]